MKCPHCLVSFHDSWLDWYPSSTQTADGRDKEWFFSIKSTLCPACKERTFLLLRGPSLDSIWRRDTVYPKGIARPVAPEVVKEFAGDFREACLVIGDSNKASAALSRRCLQNLLSKKAKTSSRNLAKQIQEVIDSGNLPSHLVEAIDGVRAIGNFAAHPIKSTNTGEIIEVHFSSGKQ